ncbi:NACHT domain-containing protein [Streptomyces vinaceus]|uniref:NACHT domain-containing protein n=1 Tax=Streptomyces vinaceus TaxID=1960 RepID=A0A5J6JKI6_STRVI|nr:NACHT domain-containing protein [Streptomyces vinaceus]QEV48018.1 NACHT domain-containing protein [Streptomyces vinaceus]GHE62140.1 ATP-binding protein [Streptomyces vinaceus]
MTGFETVVLRVAGTAAGALVKSLLSRSPGAGLAADPAAPAPRWRRPAELGDPEIRRLTQALASRMGPACGSLPEHERLAALDAVADAFATLGPLTPESLFAVDLDPAALAATLPPPPPGLSPPAGALYGRLIRLCCAHAVEYVTTLPAFGARTDVELVRRTGELGRALDRLADRSDGAAHAFEERYARYVAEAHGRLQLFGVTTGRARQEWPLDLAYISLAVTGEQELMPGGPGTHQTSVRAEQALGTAERVLLRGPAGSGKSTLVQWLALNAARQAEGPWSTCVPFVLRLRSFTSADALPLPEEFLRASGVPLTAPPGWVEELMASGRALVLVDGVDEVPQRLRTRTEAWLRSLITAFPKARYVVTTRPSAVPESWLAGQGFAPHSLLPMEREDVRAFVRHWHAAARAEGQEVDAYEASLLEAVAGRRDLGRLATNPLMCALLCALNQDRRMQLPRARKELYDAALDMLLVRRDTEREILGVEGVYLTREEQIALLQRFAYWLIRNGQVEAVREEAVEMVGEWLDAMPQVRADAEQVFSHLLIRSGLLREPVRGSVDFVHRTFQDYLGAKAAVEARDFGVLVKNAQDDTWDDVVRMAVGHARPDERVRILRGLLRRADKVKGARNRLILLAAACLEHAPELDPAVRADVQERTARLLPPRTRGQAEELAKAGELVLELLPLDDDLGEDEAEAIVRTAGLVGGVRALEIIARFRRDNRLNVAYALADSWGRFDAGEYADAVLSAAPMSGASLLVSTGEQLAQVGRLTQVKRINLHWAPGLPELVGRRPDLEWLFVYRNEGLGDLSLLAPLDRLAFLGLSLCPNVTDLAPLAGLPLRELSLVGLPDRVPLEPLRELGLDTLALGCRTSADRVGDLPLPEGLQTLHLLRGAEGLSLEGLDRWTGLRSLAVTGDGQADELARVAKPALTSLTVTAAAPDLARLPRHDRLTALSLNQCSVGDLAPLRALPGLRNLMLNHCGETHDLSPLSGLDGLTVTVFGTAEVTGAEGIPPERLRLRRP